MPRKLPQRDPINADRRKAKAARSLGVGSRCHLCPETRAEALIPNTSPMICAQCQRKKKGKTPMDQHHIAGKSNSPITTSIPVNDHRAVLSTAQHDWPKPTLENPGGCPLRKGAAHIRGFVDTVVYYTEQFLLWVAEMLEVASDYLNEKFGPGWWIKTDLNKFATGGPSNGKP
jgi:hypothetical protein